MTALSDDAFSALADAVNQASQASGDEDTWVPPTPQSAAAPTVPVRSARAERAASAEASPTPTAPPAAAPAELRTSGPIRHRRPPAERPAATPVAAEPQPAPEPERAPEPEPIPQQQSAPRVKHLRGGANTVRGAKARPNPAPKNLQRSGSAQPEELTAPAPPPSLPTAPQPVAAASSPTTTDAKPAGVSSSGGSSSGGSSSATSSSGLRRRTPSAKREHHIATDSAMFAALGSALAQVAQQGQSSWAPNIWQVEKLDAAPAVKATATSLAFATQPAQLTASFGAPTAFDPRPPAVPGTFGGSALRPEAPPAVNPQIVGVRLFSAITTGGADPEAMMRSAIAVSSIVEMALSDRHDRQRKQRRLGAYIAWALLGLAGGHHWYLRNHLMVVLYLVLATYSLVQLHDGQVSLFTALWLCLFAADGFFIPFYAKYAKRTMFSLL